MSDDDGDSPFDEADGAPPMVPGLRVHTFSGASSENPQKWDERLAPARTASPAAIALAEAGAEPGMHPLPPRITAGQANGHAHSGISLSDLVHDPVALRARCLDMAVQSPECTTLGQRIACARAYMTFILDGV